MSLSALFYSSWRKREDINNAPSSQATGHWTNLALILSHFLPKKNKNETLQVSFLFFLAEARGFEPPRHCCPHDFESCAFNHSATLPLLILSQ